MRIANGPRTTIVTLALLAAVVTAPAQSATIVIINNNAAGVGFNDPTPAAPVGGNPGTTVGQQRLFVFQYAANIWGALLPSTVQIDVVAQFTGLTCTATSAVLGSAGPASIGPCAPWRTRMVVSRTCAPAVPVRTRNYAA